MAKYINSLKGFKPLVYLGDKLVLSKFNKIYISTLDLDSIEYICSIEPVGILKSIISRVRILQRLFRLEIGPAVQLEEDNSILLSFLGQFY